MTSNASRRAIKAEVEKIKANATILWESLNQLELDEAKEAAKGIKKSSFKVLKILGVDGLNAIQDFVESIHQGSTIVLIKEENFDQAVAALQSASCGFEVLPEIDRETAIANFAIISSENEARRQSSEEKAAAIEIFSFEAWKSDVERILESPVGTAEGQLKAKVQEFYTLIDTVTGERFTWTKEDADAVFLQKDKRSRRHIVNLAFKLVLQLVRKHLAELKLGNERETELLNMLSNILFR